jgi:predicted nucleotidyltransferase
MPYFKKTPAFEKMEELSKKVPAALSWLVPDPYDPTSYVMPVAGMTKVEAQIIKSLPLPLKKNLAKILSHIRKIYPEVEQISLAGSAARGEMDKRMFGSKIKKSDIDILMSFPQGTDLQKMGMREQPLWDNWNRLIRNPWSLEEQISKNPWGRTIDFLKTISGEHSHTGEHLSRLQEGLPTPEIPLWKKRK